MLNNNFSFFGLFIMVVILYASSTQAAPLEDNNDGGAEKRYASNLHLGFGKRSSNTVPYFGLGKRAPFSQYHMGLGKRSNELNDVVDANADEQINPGEIYYILPEVAAAAAAEDNFDSQKRFDKNSFHMGFGKRSSIGDTMKRFSSNQFHMGLGKRSTFDITSFPVGKPRHQLPQQSPSNNNLLLLDNSNNNKLAAKDVYLYLCHPVRLAMLLEHAIDLRNVCPNK